MAELYRSFCSVLEEEAGEGRGGGVREGGAEEGDASAGAAAALSARVHADLIGEGTPFRTPFGERRVLYTDWTASGRALGMVERFVLEKVLPFYGNTHTTTSITGAQSTCFRHEARQIVAQAVNAKITGRAAVDTVLFTGAGSTSAINKLVGVLGLNVPMPSSLQLSSQHRPVVFVSSLEHHSNLLPWRESVADVVTVRSDRRHGIDLDHLQQLLTGPEYGSRALKIGAFSAASNITGKLVDTARVAILLHRHGALACFDFATAAPYVDVNMNQVLAEDGVTPLDGDPSLDAIAISAHKFVGGPAASGVLVIKKRLLSNAVPSVPGGGTVFYVTEQDHRFLSNRVEREEGGTPDIVGNIRAGFVFFIKQRIGASHIERTEFAIARHVRDTLAAHPNVVLLGHDIGDDDAQPPFNVRSDRFLPIFSFLIRAGQRFLHFAFVCALLNDLFGVQSRGGCQCSGPYAQQLLGLTAQRNAAFQEALLAKQELLRPGFTRIALPFFTPPEKVDFVLQAVLFVAEHGHDFLPAYRYDHKTGEWAHHSRITRFPERLWMSDLDFHVNPTAEEEGGAASTTLATTKTTTTEEKVGADPNTDTDAQHSIAALIVRAHEAREYIQDKRRSILHLVPNPIEEDYESLRWFALASDSDDNRNESTGAIVGGLAPVAVTGVAGAAGVTAAPAAAAAAETHGDTGARTADVATVATKHPARTTQGGVVEAPAYLSSDWVAAVTGRSCAPIDLSALGIGVSHIAPTKRMLKQRQQPAEPTPVTAAALAATLSLEQEPLPVPVRRPTSRPEGGAEDGVSDKTGSDSALQRKPSREVVDERPSAAAAIPRPVNAKQAQTEAGMEHSDLDATKGAEAGAGVEAVECGEEEEDDGDLAHLAGFDDDEEDEEKKEGDTTRNGAPQPEQMSEFASARRPSRLGKSLVKLVTEAVTDWNMIEEGDRLLIGISGGKDSMSLLHLLLRFRAQSQIKFEIAAATVDPQTPSFDPSPLIGYMRSLGMTYHYLSDAIIDRARESLVGNSLCAFCSRFKRGMLYTCATTHGYNKLILAQHLDDLAETFIMSAFHNGQIRTMRANYQTEHEGIRVIRPLIYAREHLLRDFAKEQRLPLINENCPACFEDPKERQRTKKLLAKEESLFPTLFSNLRHALLPIMDEEPYGPLLAVPQRIRQARAEYFARREEGARKDAERRQRERREMEQLSGYDSDDVLGGGCAS